MVAYYNEFDPFAADWLEELIKAKMIAEGVVDRRSITEVEPNDLKDFKQCHFFAGIGGWGLAARLAGWSDDRPMWTGSPPCQPFSSAGKQKGQDDLRHLWPVFFNLIRECQPSVVFGEQVASAVRFEWFDDLRSDMEKENYATGMVVLPACSIGAPHKRDRLFYVAHSISKGLEGHWESREQSFPKGWEGAQRHSWESRLVEFRDGYKRPLPTQPLLQPMVNGVSPSVGAMRGAGNAIVPQVGAEVIRAYMNM